MGADCGVSEPTTTETPSVVRATAECIIPDDIRVHSRNIGFSDHDSATEVGEERGVRADVKRGIDGSSLESRPVRAIRDLTWAHINTQSHIAISTTRVLSPFHSPFLLPSLLIVRHVDHQGSRSPGQ